MKTIGIKGNVEKGQKGRGRGKKKDQSSGEEWKEWAENHSKHFESHSGVWLNGSP